MDILVRNQPEQCVRFFNPRYRELITIKYRSSWGKFERIPPQWIEFDVAKLLGV